MQKDKKYIIIDDDSFFNRLWSIMIKKTLGAVDIKTFTQAEEALEFIQAEYAQTSLSIILFLDINMPTLTGWEFMEEYEKFSEEIKKQFSIYILSSSINKGDIEKAKANCYIKDFFSKPLLQETILAIAAAG